MKEHVTSLIPTQMSRCWSETLSIAARIILTFWAITRVSYFVGYPNKKRENVFSTVENGHHIVGDEI
jgi:hypothetical protein